MKHRQMCFQRPENMTTHIFTCTSVGQEESVSSCLTVLALSKLETEQAKGGAYKFLVYQRGAHYRKIGNHFSDRSAACCRGSVSYTAVASNAILTKSVRPQARRLEFPSAFVVSFCFTDVVTHPVETTVIVHVDVFSVTNGDLRQEM